MDSGLVPRPGVSGPGGEQVRMFSDAAIQSQLDSALSRLGKDKMVATVTYVDPAGPVGGELKLAVATRLGENWSVVGTLAHSAAGNAVAGEVRWSH